MIIGEAETGKSLEHADTLIQIRAFMSTCDAHAGSILVLAVPWDRVRLAAAILRQCKAQGCGQHVQTYVIERLTF